MSVTTYRIDAIVRAPFFTIAHKFIGQRTELRRGSPSAGRRMAAIGTYRTSRNVRLESETRTRADIDQVALINCAFMSTRCKRVARLPAWSPLTTRTLQVGDRRP